MMTSDAVFVTNFVTALAFGYCRHVKYVDQILVIHANLTPRSLVQAFGTFQKVIPKKLNVAFENLFENGRLTEHIYS